MSDVLCSEGTRTTCMLKLEPAMISASFGIYSDVLVYLPERSYIRLQQHLHRVDFRTRTRVSQRGP